MKTILIVEDEQSQKNALFTKLTAEGFRVLTAENVAEGWIYIVNEQPDLVLLDIMLPGGSNGFDLLEKLKRDSRFAAIPVMVLTNLDSEEVVARKIGVVDYMVKANTTLDEIVRRIKANCPPKLRI